MMERTPRRKKKRERCTSPKRGRVINKKKAKNKRRKICKSISVTAVGSMMGGIPLLIITKVLEMPIKIDIYIELAMTSM